MATVEIAQRCLDEDFADLPDKVQHGILKKLEILATSPEYGKPLVQKFGGLRRMTYGPYRVLYRYHQQSETVFVLVVGLRKGREMDDVYSWLSHRLQTGQTERPVTQLLEEIIKQSKTRGELKRGGA